MTNVELALFLLKDPFFSSQLLRVSFHGHYFFLQKDPLVPCPKNVSSMFPYTPFLLSLHLPAILLNLAGEELCPHAIPSPHLLSIFNPHQTGFISYHSIRTSPITCSSSSVPPQPSHLNTNNELTPLLWWPADKAIVSPRDQDTLCLHSLSWHYYSYHCFRAQTCFGQSSRRGPIHWQIIGICGLSAQTLYGVSKEQ